MTVSQPLAERFDPIGQYRDDPYPLYEEARKAGIFYAPKVDAWVVARYDDVMEVLRHPEVYSSRNALRPLVPLGPEALAELAKSPATGLSVTNTDGEDHRRLRGPLARLLTAERVTALAPRIRQRAEELVDDLAEAGAGERVDLVARLSAPYPFVVILDLMGIDEADRADAMHYAFQTVRWIADPLPPEEQAACVRDTLKLQHLLGSYLRRRHAEPRGDLISGMAEAFGPDGAELTDEALGEAITALWTIILAGHSTTAELIGTAMRHLLADRDQWNLLCAQPEQIPAAAEELIRFDSPVQSFFRYVTQDTTLGGTHLPAGTELLIVYASANRDEEHFARAGELDVSREPARHLAFAWGLHYCLGAHLARTEFQAILATLTRRLPTLRLVEDQTIEYVPNLRVRGPRSLLVTW